MNKPEVKHVTFSRREGNFNFLNPNEVKVNYSFNFPHLTKGQIKELGLDNFYSFKLEDDYTYMPSDYTAYDCAYELMNQIEGYFFHSDSKHIKVLVDYLESIEEEQVKLRHEYDIEYAKYKIKYWESELELLISK